MIVEIHFPSGPRLQLAFSGSNVPRIGERLRIGQAPEEIPPALYWSVLDVQWVVGRDGCNTAILKVEQVESGPAMQVGLRGDRYERKLNDER